MADMCERLIVLVDARVIRARLSAQTAEAT